DLAPALGRGRAAPRASNARCPPREPGSDRRSPGGSRHHRSDSRAWRSGSWRCVAPELEADDPLVGALGLIDAAREQRANALRDLCGGEATAQLPDLGRDTLCVEAEHELDASPELRVTREPRGIALGHARRALFGSWNEARAGDGAVRRGIARRQKNVTSCE